MPDLSRRRLIVLSCCVLAAGGLSACKEKTGPEKIRYDRETCEICNMIISDPRFRRPKEFWVADMKTGRKWLDARKAWYLPGQTTPMDYGFGAIEEKREGAVDYEEMKKEVIARGLSMYSFWQTARLDISESIRSKWFALYALVFGGLIATLFVFGLTESRVMGFTGLSRMLVTFIQLTMAILPIFVLLSTVRSLAGDREAGVYEYMLSFPVSLSSWYWGRFIGRFIVVFIPVFAAMGISFCFLGISFLISAISRTSDVAQSVAFFLWLVMLMFLDLILIGLLIQFQTPAEVVVGLALTNPLEVFRIGAMMLFDPHLLGPAAYIILDFFGNAGFMAYALLYPLLLGFLLAGIGFLIFRRTDLP